VTVNAFSTLPPRWKLHKLGACVRLINGRAYSQHELLDSGTPVIRIQNLNGGDRWYYSDLNLPEDKYCHRGDLLFAWSASFGPYIWNGEKSIFHYHIWRVIPNEFLEKAFAFRLLDWITAKVKSASRGVAMLHMTKSGMEAWPIALPPITEQRRIAAILDQADALRAKRREALVQLDNLKQSIFIEMFGDPSTNPKDWPSANLGSLIHSASDGPHVSPTYADSGVPFLSARHVRPGEISWHDLKFLTQEDAKLQWKKCKPGRGDILYTKGGTTGFAAVVKTDEQFAVWVHVALLRPNRDLVDSTWLEAMLNSDYCYRQSQDLTHGIANRDLGLKRMVKIQMYCPPLALQLEFSRRMSQLANQKELQRSALSELDGLFESLQHRAFRGEL